jgi:hypothetical protein
MRHPRFELCCCRPGAVRRGVVTGGFIAPSVTHRRLQARTPVSGQALAGVVGPVADRWTHEGYTTLRLRGCFEAMSRRNRRSDGVRRQGLEPRTR